MNKKKIFSLFLLLVLPLSLSACLKVNSGVNKKEVLPDAGFYVTQDKGETWKQQVAILTTGGAARSFGTESVASMTVDPSDTKTIYFGTVGQGLLMSTDRGLSWQIVYGLGQGTVNSIAVDPSDKCIVYAAMGNKLLKSEDCTRTWKPVFTDTENNIAVTNVSIDYADPNVVYVALSRGDFIRSGDKGQSWQTIYRFGSRIKKFRIDPGNSNRMYADTAKDGLSISDDKGKTWQSKKDLLKEKKISGEIVDIEVSKEQPQLVLIATEKGILRSNDRGKTWEQLSLIQPSKDASIASLAVDPKDPKTIYYVTDTTFYKSVDGGTNWSTKPLPTTKRGRVLLIDNQAPGILYLGVSK
jgi:photosystem II stability/assembly factor-like uncharacterized protein